MDTMKEKGPLRIRYEYEQDKNATLHYAHGVWGGINSQGEIELNFYTENDKLPQFSERIVAADGSLGHEISPFDESLKIVNRHVHTRLLLNYDTARAVFDWLDDKLTALETAEDERAMFMAPDSDMQQ